MAGRTHTRKSQQKTAIGNYHITRGNLRQGQIDFFESTSSQDLKFECSVGLVQSKPFCEFTISFEGATEVINRLWYDIYLEPWLEEDSDDSDNDGSCVHISKSCFTYYIWQHVYARIVEIQSFHQTLNSNDKDLMTDYLNRIQNGPLPKAMVKYLSSIGDINDGTGAEFILNFPVWPNEAGHFGRVTKDTHYKYESMAAPLVLAQRIMQDLAYTKNGGEQIWNLPDDLVPIEKNAGMPTVNMVGWDVKEELNGYQRQIVESAGITVDSFNATILQFMWNGVLFHQIATSLQHKFSKIGYFKNILLVGSQSQMTWVSQKYSGTNKYTDGSLELNSSREMETEFIKEASAFCFRVRKDRIVSDNFCCYDFNFYKEVPDDWTLTRNFVFDYGDVSFWNSSIFISKISRYDSIMAYINPAKTIDISEETRENFNSHVFTVTFEGLPGLIDEIYNSFTKINKQFTDNISRSVFSYYIWMHVYARLVELQNYRSSSKSFVDMIRRYPVPAPIEKYLLSVGNVENYSGINLKIDFPIWPNAQGHFGKITRDTHYKYEGMAAPAVLAQRIMEDLAYSKNSNVVRTWNLPIDVRPNEDNAGLPTRNLLGWGLREKLTESQQLLLKYAGITTDIFPSSFEGFLYNYILFESVGEHLYRHNIRAISHMKESNINGGSLSQLLWQKRDERQEEVFDRLIQYCERPLRQMSYRFQDNEVVMVSLICSFRVKKGTIGNLDSYCCYDFNGYQEVPDDWKQTRNTIFEYGRDGVWNDSKFLNSSMFLTAVTAKNPYRRSWVRYQLTKIC